MLRGILRLERLFSKGCKEGKKAMSWLSNLLTGGSSGKYQAGRDAINLGYSDLSKLYETGRGDLTGAYTDALKPWTEVSDMATKGASAYADALGINGAEGTARAGQAFTSTPGYQQGLNSTLDQLDRRMASRGMLASGNTMDATAQAATNYANKNYQDYVKNLNPYLQQQTAGAVGQSGVLTGLGSGLNQSYMSQGTSALNRGNMLNSNYTAQAAADQAAANSGFNLFGNIVGLGTKLLGFM